MSRSILALAWFSACAGTIGDSGEHASWSQHMADARRHDELADVHARAVAEIPVGEARYACGDTVINDQSTSGGQPLAFWNLQPCWDAEEEVRVTQRAAESRERALAKHDRHTAALLARDEAVACQQVPPAERTHSPFAHAKEISSVTPDRENGVLRGVRIAFRPVRGLDADWMRRSIACRRAQWETFGRDPELDPDDPTLLDSAGVSVAERGGRVEVLITSAIPADAELALARANRRAALANR